METRGEVIPRQGILSMSLNRIQGCRTCLPWCRLSSCLALALLLLSACGERGVTPEEQVRRYIAKGEATVEARKLTDIRDLIAENYSDADKRTRRDLLRLIGGYLLRHKSIHLLTRTDHLRIKNERQAEVVLYVAMAGSPISGVEQLLAMRADLHRFELELGKNKDDDWQLLSARWRRATMDDFLQGR